ncbi:MAG: caspase family protein [Proteobacteria bacterium]|nr:caspase family protein [Pseudomonadota bacterium]
MEKKTRFSYSIVIVWLFLFPLISIGQERGFQKETVPVAPVEISDMAGKAIGYYKNSYALLIGIDDYKNGWPKLKGTNRDLNAVRGELEKRGFQVFILKNPDDRQLKDAFDDFINRFGVNKYNRILIYYAGHGHSEKQAYGEAMGYLVPVNAPNPRQNKPGFLKTALDMQQIEVYAKRIQANHAIFLFDSCFSGSIFSIPRSNHLPISDVFDQPVRQFITSGSADETVPDESIFRKQFLAGLNGEADLNRDGNVTGSELGEHLSHTVELYSKNTQHPQYGKLRNPHLDKGEFIFKVKTDPAVGHGKTYLIEGKISEIVDYNPVFPDESSTNSGFNWKIAALTSAIGFGWLTWEYTNQYNELADRNEELKSLNTVGKSSQELAKINDEYSDNQSEMDQVEKDRNVTYALTLLSIGWGAYLFFSESDDNRQVMHSIPESRLRFSAIGPDMRPGLYVNYRF